MKCKPVRALQSGEEDCSVEDATHVILCFPGPLSYRRLPVVLGNKNRRGTPCWSWNGDTEKPTLKPSIRTKGSGETCHSFVNDGKVQFLSDCTHELAGQTLELLEVDC